MSKSSPHPESPQACAGFWRESLRVRSDDVDFRKRATGEALCRWFLEAAWNHAEQLGVGYNQLAEQNRFWVLARLLLQVENSPVWGQAVELVTWPRDSSGALALRDFEMCDSSGKRLVAGTSSWLVLDAQNRRPQRLDKLLLGIPERPKKMALDQDAQKLPEPSVEIMSLSTAVRYSDIDVNCHVNSARYIGWLLDSYSREHHENHGLKTITVNYLGETVWGENVLVSTQTQAPLRFAHSILNARNQATCRAELSWRLDGAETVGQIRPSSS